MMLAQLRYKPIKLAPHLTGYSLFGCAFGKRLQRPRNHFANQQISLVRVARELPGLRGELALTRKDGRHRLRHERSPSFQAEQLPLSERRIQFERIRLFPRAER